MSNKTHIFNSDNFIQNINNIKNDLERSAF